MMHSIIRNKIQDALRDNAPLSSAHLSDITGAPITKIRDRMQCFLNQGFAILTPDGEFQITLSQRVVDVLNARGPSARASVYLQLDTPIQDRGKVDTALRSLVRYKGVALAMGVSRLADVFTTREWKRANG